MRVEWVVVLAVSLIVNAGLLGVISGYRNLTDDLIASPRVMVVQQACPPIQSRPNPEDFRVLASYYRVAYHDQQPQTCRTL